MNGISPRPSFSSLSMRFIGAAIFGLVCLAHPDLVLAQTEPAEEVEITEKARAHFRAGVNLLQDPDGPQYDEAYQQFQAAYAESPSWKVLGNIGLCAMKLERYDEAIEAFRQYLERGGEEIGEAEREQYQRDIETLSASVATLKLRGTPRSKITDVRKATSGRDIRNFYVIPESGELEIGVRPGQHSFTVNSPDGTTDSWEVLVKGASSHEHSFVTTAGTEGAVGSESQGHDATTADSGSGGDYRVPGYIALGVGVAGVGLGTLFLVQRSGKLKDGNQIFSDCEISQTCGTDEIQAIENADQAAATKGTLSLISYGVGAAGLGTGIALLLMSRGDSPLEAEVGQLRVRPYASFNQMGIFGSF